MCYNSKTMNKEKLSDQVAARIKQDILDKKYTAGEKIPAEPELMKIYAVGRSSVREAIKSLAMTGILQVRQGDGTYINAETASLPLNPRLRNADFDEINAVRQLLDVEIVRLAVDHHTDEDLAAMQKHLDDRKQAILDEDRQACMNADVAFHTSIARASANSVLAELYQNFTQTIRSFFSQREPQGLNHFAMSHHLHEDLYNAIRRKKQKQALEVIRHILNNNY